MGADQALPEGRAGDAIQLSEGEERGKGEGMNEGGKGWRNE